MITPRSEQDVADAVATASGTLRVMGGGTRQSLGNPVVSDGVLSIAGLSGITLYEPGALTLVAKSGTPLAEIETALAAEGQRLSFEPIDHRGLLGTKGEPTIGGVVACNVSGPRRVQAGACRDSLIGVRFVDGLGQVIKNGGRVMKNVTGYDLVKLMAGSYGTLGVLTEVAFKVLPMPEAQAILVVRGQVLMDGVTTMSAALGSPYDVTGAAYIPAPDSSSVTMIRVEGFEASVAYRIEKLAALVGVGQDVEIQQGRAMEPLTQLTDFQGAGVGDVWRISVKPTDAPDVGTRLNGSRLVFDWGGGLIWALATAGTDVRAALSGITCHATIVRASDATRTQLGTFQAEPKPLADLAAGLRRKFDPKQILNPEIMT